MKKINKFLFDEEKLFEKLTYLETIKIVNKLLHIKESLESTLIILLKMSKKEIDSFNNHQGMVNNINEQLFYVNKNIEISKKVELKHEDSVLDKENFMFKN